MTVEANLRVNGIDHRVEIQSHETLGCVLNERLGLNGVRLSCEEGECGSCTVLIDDAPVTACLILAVQAQRREILTIEGLGTPERLHPIQQAFIDEHGFQCSFCTPGFILSTKALLEDIPLPEPTEIATALGGHICRCGSYPNIVRSVLRAAEALAKEAPAKEAGNG
jgi:aerobic-type carbon monoxide dehydrogenase small subunit (CoxS/CutS family)